MPHIYRGSRGRAAIFDRLADSIRTDPRSSFISKKLLERMQVLGISNVAADNSGICQQWADEIVQRINARHGGHI